MLDFSSRRRVLADVPRVGFYPDMKPVEPGRGPEDIIFPSCMRAAMQFLGHPEYDYIHFVGVTGAGFYFNWKDGWHDDNAAIYFMVPFDEHINLFRYAFDSTGYTMDFHGVKGPDGLDEAETRRRIVANIDAGRPVLSHGVVGPPETCILTGYDEAGDVLLGWSFFQNFADCREDLEFEPNGMFRRRNWYENTWDLFAIGERGEPANPAFVRRRSLEWAIKVVRTAETWDGRTHNGLAAYDAWAEALLHDDEITPDGAIPVGSSGQPFGVHDDAVGTVAEGRYYACQYLRRVAKAEPAMAEHLLRAADCYQGEHDLMWEIWACCGGNGRTSAHVERFADPIVRRKIIPLIAEAKRLDLEAVTHIETALAVH